MAAQNPNQLLLLADHIKLSLLERQRAQSLNLEAESQDGHIARSLEFLRDGLQHLGEEVARLQNSGDASVAALQDSYDRLNAQYNDLSSDFYGHEAAPSDTLTQPNNPELAEDFAHAAELPAASTSSLKKAAPSASLNKSVRFSEPAAGGGGMMPYRDDPESDVPDHGVMDNQQIHSYHSRVLEEQDEQLERLGVSIGRQRELSIQIGDELDSQVELLEAVDGQIDRHQTNLDRARRNLGSFARRASENTQMTIIVVLIVVLVLLIIILK